MRGRRKEEEHKFGIVDLLLRASIPDRPPRHMRGPAGSADNCRLRVTAAFRAN
jgi:hypothetical protein